ncbi:hypothetical protein TNCV_2196481 [Trichonephila clavipes]|nr:hypothetical protein TNCV_2196481 [Trichonephila clavipes]
MMAIRGASKLVECTLNDKVNSDLKQASSSITQELRMAIGRQAVDRLWLFAVYRHLHKGGLFRPERGKSLTTTHRWYRLQWYQEHKYGVE